MRKEAGYRKRIQEVTAELARHFEQGRDYARAVEYLRQAGERALTRSACHEARAYFEQALSALSHLPETRETRGQAIDLWLALRTALQPLGDLGRVLTCLRTAEALAVALDDSCRLARISLLLSRYFSLMGMYNQAITAPSTPSMSPLPVGIPFFRHWQTSTSVWLTYLRATIGG
jgi:predicted ATPase